jgi:hypothetical protein
MHDEPAAKGGLYMLLRCNYFQLAATVEAPMPRSVAGLCCLDLQAVSEIGVVSCVQWGIVIPALCITSSAMTIFLLWCSEA